MIKLLDKTTEDLIERVIEEVSEVKRDLIDRYKTFEESQKQINEFVESVESITGHNYVYTVERINKSIEESLLDEDRLMKVADAREKLSDHFVGICYELQEKMGDDLPDTVGDTVWEIASTRDILNSYMFADNEFDRTKEKIFEVLDTFVVRLVEWKDTVASIKI